MAFSLSVVARANGNPSAAFVSSILRGDGVQAVWVSLHREKACGAVTF